MLSFTSTFLSVTVPVVIGLETDVSVLSGVGSNPFRPCNLASARALSSSANASLRRCSLRAMRPSSSGKGRETVSLFIASPFSALFRKRSCISRSRSSSSVRLSASMSSRARSSSVYLDSYASLSSLLLLRSMFSTAEKSCILPYDFTMLSYLPSMPPLLSTRAWGSSGFRNSVVCSVFPVSAGSVSKMSNIR